MMIVLAFKINSNFIIISISTSLINVKLGRLKGRGQEIAFLTFNGKLLANLS